MQERLTIKCPGGAQIDECENDLCEETCSKYGSCDQCPINAAINKLYAYEEAEEQGTLLRLPCKVNEEFYVIDPQNDFKITFAKCAGYTICVDTKSKTEKSYIWADSLESPFNYWKIEFEQFDKRCFTEKEAAETAAQAMKEDKECRK